MLVKQKTTGKVFEYEDGTPDDVIKKDFFEDARQRYKENGDLKEYQQAVRLYGPTSGGPKAIKDAPGGSLITALIAPEALAGKASFQGGLAAVDEFNKSKKEGQSNLGSLKDAAISGVEGAALQGMMKPAGKILGMLGEKVKPIIKPIADKSLDIASKRSAAP